MKKVFLTSGRGVPVVSAQEQCKYSVLLVLDENIHSEF